MMPRPAPGLQGSAVRPMSRQVTTAATPAAGTPASGSFSDPQPEGTVTRHPVVVALTGASGAPYGVRLLDVLARHQVPVWLVASSHGMRLLHDECGIDTLDALREATGGDWGSVTSFPDGDRGALPASGSQRTARHGDLPVLDGHGRGHRRRHQPLARRARRGRDAQRAAEARSWCRARRRSR